MNSKIKISIKQPCEEKWSEMLPAEQGRYCIACERLITDFSSKSDQEVLNFIKQANGKICGRFSVDQLERNLIFDQQQKNIPLWQKMAASVLLFIGVDRANASEFSFTKNDFTYIESKVDTIENSYSDKNVLQSDSIQFTGKIIDNKTKESLPFVHISSKKHNVSTQSDFHGNFTIAIPKVDSLKELELSIAVIGYAQKIIKIDIENSIQKNLKDKNYQIISLDNICLEGSYLTGIIDVNPEKKWYQLKK